MLCPILAIYTAPALRTLSRPPDLAVFLPFEEERFASVEVTPDDSRWPDGAAGTAPRRSRLSDAPTA